MRSRLKCQTAAIVADHGFIPEVSDLFGKRGRRLLASLDLPTVSRSRVDANLRVIDEITEEIELADRELRHLFRGDDRIRRLTAIPGIGFTTAAVVTAEVWDVSRFPSPDKLCSWAGLTPLERSISEALRRGHISKQGSRWLRWILSRRPPAGRTTPRCDRSSGGSRAGEA